MAKITTTMVDGWPVMKPLGRRETALLGEELGGDERVLGQAIATNGQIVVATDRRVLVIKTGVRSGQIFGGTVTSYDYPDIADITITTRIAEGDFEVVERQPAIPDLSWAHAALIEENHGVVFSKLDAAAFSALAAKIRERLSSAGN